MKIALSRGNRRFLVCPQTKPILGPPEGPRFDSAEKRHFDSHTKSIDFGKTLQKRAKSGDFGVLVCWFGLLPLSKKYNIYILF